MNTKVVKKFLYAPALFTALALIATSECLAIGAERQDRDDDYLNIYWKDGRGFEWKPGASEGTCYPCNATQMANYLVFWINRGGLYNYPLIFSRKSTRRHVQSRSP